MKSIISFLALSIVLLNSCTKYDGLDSLSNQARTPAVNTTPDSLRGLELLFDSLAWIDNDFGYPVFYLEDSNYFMPGRQISVEIKHDTLVVWEQVNKYYGGMGSWGYLYNMSIGVLAVWPNPAQPALIGKGFSLKVKFL